MTAKTFPDVTLTTKRLVIRAFRAADAYTVHRVWNDEEYLRFAPAGLDIAGADIERATRWCTMDSEAQRRDGHAMNLAVEGRDEGGVVGHVALFGTNWTTAVTDIHYWTVPWARRRGYATEAVLNVAQWALCDAELSRITLKVAAANVASRRVAEAAAFRFEGIMRNAALTRSGRDDLVIYGLIPEDLSSAVR